jgi:cysteine desulfuration protein SufE
MGDIVSTIPPRLASIIEDFELLEGREGLEVLLEYAEKLPPLPDWLQGRRDEMEPVPECMTPVHLFSELQEGQMVFYFDVPAESPTVRGFAELLREGLEGCTPEQVLALPGDLYLRFGLEKLLTHQRLNGLAALLAHIRHQAMLQI